MVIKNETKGTVPFVSFYSSFEFLNIANAKYSTAHEIMNHAHLKPSLKVRKKQINDTRRIKSEIRTRLGSLLLPLGLSDIC